MCQSQTNLQRPGLLRLADGLHERRGRERLDAPVPEAGRGGTILEEIEGVVGYVPVEPEYGGDVDDLEVGAEAVDGDHGTSGVRVGGRGGGVDGERALELGEEAGEGGGGAGEDGVALEGEGREGGDEARGEEGVLVIFAAGRRGGGGLDGGGEVGGDEGERVEGGEEGEEGVRVEVALEDDAGAGGALGDGARERRLRRRAPRRPRRAAVGALRRLRHGGLRRGRRRRRLRLERGRLWLWSCAHTVTPIMYQV